MIITYSQEKPFKDSKNIETLLKLQRIRSLNTRGKNDYFLNNWHYQKMLSSAQDLPIPKEVISAVRKLKDILLEGLTSKNEARNNF